MAHLKHDTHGKRSGWAIASLIIGIIAVLTIPFSKLPGWAIVGIIVSAITLSKLSKDRGLKGKGLATAGLILSIIGFVAVIVILLASSNESHKTTTIPSLASQPSESSSQNTVVPAVKTEATAPQVQQVNTQPKETPSQIAESWSKEVVSGSATEKNYLYLNPETRLKYYPKFYNYEDEVYRMNRQWIMQGVYRTFMDVEKETIQGNSASVTVIYKFKMPAYGYQKTLDTEMNFTKVDNEWKLNEFYDLN